MSRTLVYAVLRADAILPSNGSLKDLGVKPGSIFAAEAADDIKDFPFITMRWGNAAPGVGPSQRKFVDVWAHHRDQDYIHIDAILSRVEFLLTNITAAETDEGYITQIDWQGRSPDLRDDGYDTRTRNSTFLVIGSTR